MRTIVPRLSLPALAVVSLALEVRTFAAQPERKPDISASALETSLRGFLQKLEDDKTTRYYVAFGDLNNDRTPEAIVYLISNGRCGSGGCNTLILTRDRASWRIVSNITITRPPIRVLTNMSNGWHAIGVRVEGGGILPGYEAELRFDGKTYPQNPSIPPARPLVNEVQGQILIPAAANKIENDKLLYQTLPEDQAKAASEMSQLLGPSFRCASAKTPTEKLVCSEPDLASLDGAMALAYHSALQGLPKDKAIVLRREQSEWLKHYARACDSLASDVPRRECITRYLGARAKRLKSQIR